jgi:thymidylate synthase ThyX
VFSRNAASTRAIPVSKTIQKVQHSPFVPVYWGKAQSGMVADEELSPAEIEVAQAIWLEARDNAIKSAQALVDAKVHKQIAGRLLEPFQFVTVIVSSTEWQNFFDLRCHHNAQPEIRKIAEMMQSLYLNHTPTQLAAGSWHIPMAEDKNDLLANGYELKDVIRIACARIARVSYETHDGKRDPSADLQLCNKLESDRHHSPLEHVAMCQADSGNYRNFRGFRQYRTFVDGGD